MSSKRSSDDEARLAWLLSQFQDQQTADSGSPSFASLESELDGLSIDDLEELIAGNDCLRLLQDLSEANESAKVVGESQPSCEGQQIGKYTVRQIVGSGGFADVYFANDTRLGRDVALKVLKSRYADDIDVVRRFEREGHAAAALAHPAIIPIYEAGRDGDRTFIAMQYCRGGDLRTYLANRQSPLSIRQAAQIGLTISQAIGLAHSKSIVHRDIKPANVLLADPLLEEESSDPATLQSLLRVSDFGLVKETTFDPELTSDGGHDSAIGTPAYMSPEQIDGGKELSTASDVFSIGVLLYELLTGVNPHRHESRSEMFRAIQLEPTTPPRRVRKEIDADLEAIVLTSLSKDPAARYPTAMHLADDLERWSQGRPVRARQPTRLELLMRWCRQNPVVAASLVIAATSLLLGTLVASWKWLDAVKQQQIAMEANRQANELRLQAEQSEQETESLLQVVFETIAAVDPSRGGDARINTSEIIKKTKKEIDAKLPDSSEKKWELVRTLAQTADGTGDYRLSSRLWEEAEQLATNLASNDDDPRVSNCVVKRVAALQACGELIESLALQRKLLKSVQNRYGMDSRETLKAMADLIALQVESGNWNIGIDASDRSESAGTLTSESRDAIDDAVDLLEQHIQLTVEKLGERDESLVAARVQLARLYYQLRKRRSANSEMRTAIDLATELFGETDARTLEAKTSFTLSVNRRSASRAVEMMTDICELASERYPPTHPVALRMQHALGLSFWHDYQAELAIETLQAAQETSLRTHGALHPVTLSLTQSLTDTLRWNGEPQKSLDIASKVTKKLEGSVGPRHRGYMELQSIVAKGLQKTGRPNEAEEICRRLAQLSIESFPKGDASRTRHVGFLWLALVEAKKFEEALDWIDRQLGDLAYDSADVVRRESFVLANKMLCLMRMDQWEEAEDLFNSFVDVTRRRTPNAFVGRALYACFQAKAGSSDAAEVQLRNAMSQLEVRVLFGDRHWVAMKQVLQLTTDLLEKQGKSAAAGRLRKMQDEFDGLKL